jgi:putative endonuclease
LQNSNRKTGLIGEDLALNYLLNQGYLLLERNWRFKHYEIDLIMKDGSFLVFVEVKARSTAAFGWPEQAVHLSKQAFLLKAAQEYLFQNNNEGELRFDIIAIILTKSGPKIEHIKDFFIP